MRVFLYSTPEHWQPTQAIGEIAAIRTTATRVGATGFIANPESGWSDISSAARTGHGRALSDGLVAASGDMSVGIVSFPLWPGLSSLTGLGGRVWGCPEMYAKGRPASATATWWARWQAIFGSTRVIPGVSGWISHISIDTAAKYDTYLRGMPPARGAIAWTENGSPAWMLERLRAWRPAGNAINSVISDIGAIATTPVGIILGLVIAAFVVLIIAATME